MRPAEIRTDVRRKSFWHAPSGPPPIHVNAQVVIVVRVHDSWLTPPEQPEQRQQHVQHPVNQAPHRSSTEPPSTPLSRRSESLRMFDAATSSRSMPQLRATSLTYQSTSPSSFLMARVVSARSPPSRQYFLIFSATSPASPLRPNAG